MSVIFIGMGISKIIQEEINDFDWVKKVPVVSVGMCLINRRNSYGNTYKVLDVRDGVVYLENNMTHMLRKFDLGVLDEWLNRGFMEPCGINESDDFDWAKNIQPFSLDVNWIITYDDESDYHNIQKWLFSRGVYWDGYSGNTNLWDSHGVYGFFFKKGVGFDNYQYYHDTKFNMEDTMGYYQDYMRIKWDNIKGI